MRREAPEINAGSMADIAFLLLIFWLVATTLKPDRGLSGILEGADDKVKIAVPTKSADILRVHVSEDGDYIINDDKLSLKDVEQDILNTLSSAGFKAKMVITADYDAPYKEYMLLVKLSEEMKIKTIQNEIYEEEQPTPEEGGGN